MYCPRCAAQNLDDVKFCRACGTNLEVVALALADQNKPAKASKDEDEKEKAEKNWMEKRSEGVGDLVKGAGLMMASLLIGIALGLFSNQPDWIVIWLGTAGWMACWGVISLSSGIRALLESKFMLRQMGLTANVIAAPAAQQLSLNDARAIPTALDTPRLSTPPSVTEQTTVPLTKQPSTSKESLQ
jgi:small basic protein